MSNVLVNQVKQVLRMSGHAVVSTVHERLNVIDQQINSISEQNTQLARTQTALLQSCIHVVETLQRVQADIPHHAVDTKQLAESLGGLKASILAGHNALLEQLKAVQDEQKRICEQSGAINQQIGQVFEALAKSEESHTSLLQSSIHFAEKLAAAPDNTTIRNDVSTLLSKYDVAADRVREAIQRIDGLERYTRDIFENHLARQVSVETDDYAFNNPETGLMEFLYSYLPTRKALDIGAHVGDISKRLLEAGYEVYAFEPYPPSYKTLVERLGQREGFHHFNFALGRVETELPMHLATDRSANGVYEDATVFNSLIAHSMPDDLPFTRTVVVPVKPLARLHPDTIPEDVSLVKIDTEGYDLEVVCGMGDHRYPVVSVEFWDTKIPFGKSDLLYTTESMVAEMRKRGYLWYVVLYRIWGRNQTAYYCNHERAVPESWGNIFFFREYETFAQAQSWCSAALPRTHFKPMPPSGV